MNLLDDDVDSIVELLEKASKAYYNSGKTIMSDAEFDRLRDRLEELDPDHPYLARVGAAASEHLAKVKHVIPMGSLNKAKDETELERWWKKYPKSKQVVGTYKMDGASIELVYKNGNLVQAITRGDGQIGEDVTANVLYFPNVPKKIGTFTGSVRGEAILTLQEYHKHFKDKINPRNAGNGLVRRKSNPQLNSHMSFYAFDLLPQGKTYWGDFQKMAKMGFDIPSAAPLGNIGMAKAFHQIAAKGRAQLNYEIDGVVFRVDNHKDFTKAGENNNRPKGAVAYKFEASEGVSILEKVELSVGQTGAIVPIGKIKPVQVGGVTISSVLLANFEEIDRLGVYLKDEVKVVRAGDVIPKIMGVAQKGKNRKKIPIPKVCPVCGKKAVKDGVHIFCKAYNCEARKLARIKLWVKKQDIKNLGDSLMEALFDAGKVTEVSHLYKLKEKELEKFPVGIGKVGRRAKKIIKEINRTRTRALEEVIGSVGIPLLGRSQSKKIIAGGLDTFHKVINATPKNIEKTGVFSKDTSKKVAAGIKKAKKELQDIIKSGVKISSNQVQEVEMFSSKYRGKRFCFTGAIQRKDENGKRYTRDMMWKLATLNGAIPDKTITGFTDYLVQADPNSNSSKTRKARSYGVTIISEAQFFSFMIPKHIQKWESLLKGRKDS